MRLSNYNFLPNVDKPQFIERYHGWDLMTIYDCYYAGGCPASLRSLEDLKIFVDGVLETDLDDNNTGKRK
jgi:hypothetical protein